MSRAFLYFLPVLTGVAVAALIATSGDSVLVSPIANGGEGTDVSPQMIAGFVNPRQEAMDLFAQAIANRPRADACVEGFRGVCFAPDTPIEYVEKISGILNQKWQETQLEQQMTGGIAYNVGNGWVSQGTPTTLTWSLVPDGLSIPGGVGEPTANSALFSRMDTLFGAANRATWILRIQQSLDRWGELSGLTFTRVTNGGNDWDDGASWGSAGAANLRGDIRFSMHTIDGANGILAYSDFPPSGDIVMDQGESWSSSSSSHRFMRNIITHELGHSLGMFHVCPSSGTKLMEPFLSTSYDGPRHDDIRAVQRLYGDADEPNDSSAQATVLGTLNAGGSITRGTLPNPVSGTNPTNSSNNSIDNASESDYFKFTITGSRTVTVTVTPQGLTYDSSTQAGNGSCNSGNNIDSSAIANLNVDLINTNGSTVLASGNSQIAGSAESISNFALAAAGDYYVRVYASGAVSGSQLYTLQLSASATCVSPTITTQPLTTTGCTGVSLMLSVVVDGSAPLSYQWKKNNVNIGGATSSAYTIASPTAADNGSYTVAVTNACGNATSDAAIVTIDSTPSISVQPATHVGCSGGNTSFSVTASGGDLQYQWRKNGVDISGATAATLNLTGLTTGSAADYDVVVSNSCGSITSNPATLTIQNAPFIVTQPNSEVACVGDSIGFFVIGGGTSPQYQWRKGGVPIPGATTSTLDFVPVGQSDDGAYDVVISNSCNSITSNTVTLTVLAATQISQQPANQSVCVGQPASFSVVASGSGTVAYQWKKDGNTIPGATSATYAIASAAAGDVATYTVVVNADCGSVTSNPATLSLGSGPSISVHPSNVDTCVGQSANFSVTAPGATGYQWRKGGVPIGGATSSSYTINPVGAGDAGSYDVVVTNSCGSATSNAASLSIGSGPSISVHPSNVNTCVGQSANFSVTASGAMSYQWRKGGVPIGGATSSSYTINPVVAGDAGSYDVVVTNSCGSATSNAALLSLGSGPSISQDPVSQTGCQGGSVTLSVTAPGATGYQWRKGGVSIGGATSSSYMINPVAGIDAGSYDVIVSNDCGNATSNPATIVVQLHGDANCDGSVNNFDIDPFVLAIVSGQAAWEAVYNCDYVCALDLSGDGSVNNFDIDPFVACILSGSCD